MEFSTSIGLMQTGMRLLAAAPPPPAATGLLADLFLERGTEMTPADLFADFTGAALMFDLAPASEPLPSGLFLSPAGTLSGTPAANAGPLNIVIRAVNPHGEAQSTFSLVVQDVILDFDASISGLLPNATHGPSAISGNELTAVATAFSATTPTELTYQWKTLESGVITGATSANFTPNAELFDGETLFCSITPTGYPSKNTSSAVVRFVAPVALGTLGELPPFDIGSGDETFDMTSFVSGTALNWSVSGQGCSIHPATGLLSIRTDSPAVAATARVTAQNSGGSVEIVFTFHVEDPAAGPGPNLSEPILDVAGNTIGLVLDESGTVYWRRDPVGTNPDPSDVIVGGGFDSGSFLAAVGSNTVSITFATGNDGVQTISFVALNAENEPSLVRTSLIEIDTIAPSLSSSSPVAGAIGVAAEISPSLTFDKAVYAAQGSVTLYDVSAGNAVEIFDTVADLGTDAGKIEIAGAQLTLHPSAPLDGGPEYAVLISSGALRDEAGNLFQGISSATVVSFSIASGAVVDTDFGADFTTVEAALWASVQANGFNVTPEHRAAEGWSAYPGALSTGGIVGAKTGNFPQLRFSIPVEVGRTYAIDADVPVGENTFSAPLRLKIGSAINLSDYGQLDETQVGQPRVVELRNFQITATSSELWFAVIVETSSSGTTGGNPALSMLRVQEA